MLTQKQNSQQYYTEEIYDRVMIMRKNRKLGSQILPSLSLLLNGPGMAFRKS